MTGKPEESRVIYFTECSVLGGKKTERKAHHCQNKGQNISDFLIQQRRKHTQDIVFDRHRHTIG